jgi:hypothetical protein
LPESGAPEVWTRRISGSFFSRRQLAVSDVERDSSDEIRKRTVSQVRMISQQAADAGHPFRWRSFATRAALSHEIDDQV